MRRECAVIRRSKACAVCRAPRKIPRGPFKVLDAPSLQDDFYLNLVDWSSQNVLAVGLGSCVYLWSACTCKVTKLTDLAPSDMVNSVAWSQRGTYLSVGTSHGDTLIFDISKLKQIRKMEGHRARVGTMAWNSHLLSTGSRDRAVLQRDVRVPDPFVQKCAARACRQHAHRACSALRFAVPRSTLPTSVASTARCTQRAGFGRHHCGSTSCVLPGPTAGSCRCSAHRSEVCGLKWSPDNRQLASGGNDNQLCIWDLNNSEPVMKFTEHGAAVKAIAWSPHQHGLLASGGGTADRCIRFWNTATGAKLTHIDAGSQVQPLCNQLCMLALCCHLLGSFAWWR
jgi:cell division cycle 20-like protein 1, cofactor of APC complex